METVRSKNAVESVLTDAIEAGVKVALERVDFSWPLSSGFITNISYALRSHLNAITGFSDILMEGDLPDEYHSYAESIFLASNQLTDLINDFIDYTNLCSGQVKPVFAPFSLHEVIASLEKEVIRTRSHSNCDFIVNIESSVPDTIVNDREQVAICLSKLVDNSFSYSNGNPVELYVYVHQNEKAMICFCFRDEGYGFEGSAENALNPNMSYGSTVLNSGNYSVLDVAITKYLLDLLGGKLEVEIDPAGFRSFTAIIPVEREITRTGKLKDEVFVQAVQSNKGQVFEASEEDNEAGKVLIIDDDASSLKIAEMLANLSGLQIDTAKCGVEGLEKASNGGYGLVIFDIWMRDMNGLELVTRLRESGSNVPVVAMTADISEETAMRCDEVGVSNYLPKPIDRASMRALLELYFPELKTGE